MKKLFILLFSLSIPFYIQANTQKINNALSQLNIQNATVTQTSLAHDIYQVKNGEKSFFMTQDGKFLFDGDIQDLSNGGKRNTSILKENKGIISTFNQVGIKSVEVTSLSDLPFKIIYADNTVMYLKDSKLLLKGKLYQYKNGSTFDVNELVMKKKIDAEKSSMIIYPAQNERYIVTVFTDITCGYCRKLHGQISEYNQLGITLRFLAYPRHGINHQSARILEDIWQRDDANIILTEVMSGSEYANEKMVNIVKKHRQLGERYGVRGTPAIILPSGMKINGYLSPERLLEELEKDDKNTNNN